MSKVIFHGQLRISCSRHGVPLPQLHSWGINIFIGVSLYKLLNTQSICQEFGTWHQQPWHSLSLMKNSDHSISVKDPGCHHDTIITFTRQHGPLPDTQNCGLRMRQECRERFSRHRIKRKSLVSDPSMHHGTSVTHVPWCMSGSLTRGDGENVPVIPGACATRNITYRARGTCPTYNRVHISDSHVI